jgi:hypothetical protein
MPFRISHHRHRHSVTGAMEHPPSSNGCVKTHRARLSCLSLTSRTSYQVYRSDELELSSSASDPCFSTRNRYLPSVIPNNPEVVISTYATHATQFEPKPKPAISHYSPIAAFKSLLAHRPFANRPKASKTKLQKLQPAHIEVSSPIYGSVKHVTHLESPTARAILQTYDQVLASDSASDWAKNNIRRISKQVIEQSTSDSISDSDESAQIATAHRVYMTRVPKHSVREILLRPRRRH